jgi:hypothetical protein
LDVADVVLVHGIDHQLSSADTIEQSWGPALAGGVRAAGFPEVADRLWRTGPVAGGFNVRAAFYGHLFRRPGVMGTGEGLSEPEEDLFGALAVECLRRAEHSASEQQRRVAREELAALGLTAGSTPQGLRAIASRLTARLARLPWFARLGMALAERFVITSLNQVTRYLTDETIRETAQREILKLIDDQTKVIVAHSLGSVVAYEVCRRMDRALPLLVTIGSPLGLGTIIYPRLRPQPPVFPPSVRRWVNVADRNDVVAAEAQLGGFFREVPTGALFEHGAVDNEKDAHRAESYMTSNWVGRSVGASLLV